MRQSPPSSENHRYLSLGSHALPTCKPGIRKLSFGMRPQSLEGPLPCLRWQRQRTQEGGQEERSSNINNGPWGRGCLLNSTGIILLGRWLFVCFLIKENLGTVVYFFNKSLNMQNKTLRSVNFSASVYKPQVSPAQPQPTPRPSRCAMLAGTESLSTWRPEPWVLGCLQTWESLWTITQVKNIHECLSKDP